jgi:hypothetical protein
VNASLTFALAVQDDEADLNAHLDAPEFWTVTNRAVGRCFGCKTVQAETRTVGRLAMIAKDHKHSTWCASCGRGMQLRSISALEVETTECNQSCTHAHGAVCRCSCGGRNHSVASLVTA